MPDLFDRISYQDIFSRIDFKDVFDRIDLPVEDKVIFSKEMRDLIREELIKKIGELPIGSIISSAVKKEMQKKLDKEVSLRSVIERKLRELDSSFKNEFKEKEEKLLKQIEELEKKLKETDKSLRQEMNKPIYEFGGFSPSFNYSNVFYFGDQNTDGSWRIVVDGTNLSVQYREAGNWIEKGSFLP